MAPGPLKHSNCCWWWFDPIGLSVRFFYSLDHRTWSPIGSTLKMKYTLPHFMGYRFGLFCYATKAPGGFADFDYFRVSSAIARAK